MPGSSTASGWRAEPQLAVVARLIQASAPPACLPVAAWQDTGQAECRRYLGVDVLARIRMTLIIHADSQMQS